MKRKLFKRSLAVVMALSIMVCGVLIVSAQSKSWSVYHSQGAPANTGVFNVTQTMKKGNSKVNVEMESYSFSDKTTKVWTYRASKPNDRKYLTTTTHSQKLTVDKDVAEKICVNMSTTSGKSVKASGEIWR